MEDKAKYRIQTLSPPQKKGPVEVPFLLNFHLLFIMFLLKYTCLTRRQERKY